MNTITKKLTEQENDLIEQIRFNKVSKGAIKYLADNIEDITDLDSEVIEAAVELQDYLAQKIELDSENYYAVFQDFHSIVFEIKKDLTEIKTNQRLKAFEKCYDISLKVLFAAYMLYDRCKIQHEAHLRTKISLKKEEKEEKKEEKGATRLPLSSGDFEYYIENKDKEKHVIYPYNPEAYHTEDFSNLKEVYFFPCLVKGEEYFKKYLNSSENFKLLYRTSNKTSFVGDFSMELDDAFTRSYKLTKVSEKEPMIIDAKLKLTDPLEVYNDGHFLLSEKDCKQIGGEDYTTKVFEFFKSGDTKTLGRWRVDPSYGIKDQKRKFVPVSSCLHKYKDLIKTAYPEAFNSPSTNVTVKEDNKNQKFDESGTIVGKDSFQIIFEDNIRYITSIDMALTKEGIIIIPVNKLNTHETTTFMSVINKVVKIKSTGGTSSSYSPHLKPLIEHFSGTPVSYKALVLPTNSSIVIVPWKAEWEWKEPEIVRLKTNNSDISVNGTDYEIKENAVALKFSSKEDGEGDLIMFSLEYLHPANLLTSVDLVEDYSNAPETLQITLNGELLPDPTYFDIVDDCVLYFSGDSNNPLSKIFEMFNTCLSLSEKYQFPGNKSIVKLPVPPKPPVRKQDFEFVK